MTTAADCRSSLSCFMSSPLLLQSISFRQPSAIHSVECLLLFIPLSFILIPVSFSRSPAIPHAHHAHIPPVAELTAQTISVSQVALVRPKSVKPSSSSQFPGSAFEPALSTCLPKPSSRQPHLSIPCGSSFVMHCSNVCF